MKPKSTILKTETLCKLQIFSRDLKLAHFAKLDNYLKVLSLSCRDCQDHQVKKERQEMLDLWWVLKVHNINKISFDDLFYQYKVKQYDKDEILYVSRVLQALQDPVALQDPTVLMWVLTPLHFKVTGVCAEINQPPRGVIFVFYFTFVTLSLNSCAVTENVWFSVCNSSVKKFKTHIEKTQLPWISFIRKKRNTIWICVTWSSLLVKMVSFSFYSRKMEL